MDVVNACWMDGIMKLWRCVWLMVTLESEGQWRGMNQELSQTGRSTFQCRKEGRWSIQIQVQQIWDIRSTTITIMIQHCNLLDRAQSWSHNVNPWSSNPLSIDILAPFYNSRKNLTLELALVGRSRLLSLAVRQGRRSLKHEIAGISSYYLVESTWRSRVLVSKPNTGLLGCLKIYSKLPPNNSSNTLLHISPNKKWGLRLRSGN